MAAAPIETIAGAERYLALDPSLSCGWALLQVKDNRLLSIACGVLKVVDASCLGTRGIDLQAQLRPLLDPPPAHVFVEAYFAHGQHGVEVNYHLRAAISMELAGRSIEYTQVAPQSWKAVVAGSGNADKAAVKAALEASLGSLLPSKLPIGGRWLKDTKGDASDAMGIGIWGVRQRHTSIAIEAVPITAPVLTPASPSGAKKRVRE